MTLLPYIVNDLRVPLARLLAGALVVALASSACAAGEQGAGGASGKHLLVLFSNNRLLPANVEADRGIRSKLQGLQPDAEISAEFLDYPRFTGEDYIRTLSAYLREKYRERPPQVVVVAGQDAFAFLMDNRRHLFPAAPVVHIAASAAQIEAAAPLPADVVGEPLNIDFRGTVELALRHHAQARHVVVVTGASAFDRDYEAQFRRDAARMGERASFEFLAGLSTQDVLARLAALDRGSVVFTPGFFQDREGRSYFPREAVSIMTKASGAPVYGPFETLIGAGVVGGSMVNFFDMGQEAAEAASAIMVGAEPASLTPPPRAPAQAQLDWREARRWQVPPHLVSRDTLVRFKEPTFWEAHRREALAATGVFALQALLISGLLVERQRRRRTEIALKNNLFQLAHASRRAIAGELTGSIAHEINQPLGAILSNAVAADLMLESGSCTREELREILQDIRRDNMRASEVIRRLRALLQNKELEHAPFDVNEAISDAAHVLRAEVQRRQAQLVVLPAPAPLVVAGDHIQIQQVVINLVLNAMDATATLPPERRAVVVQAASVQGGVDVSVADRGAGVPPAKLEQIFDSFFTTKSAGIGLGLSIARTLVESHHGRIWVENGPQEGAIFHVFLPWPAGAGDSARGT